MRTDDEPTRRRRVALVLIAVWLSVAVCAGWATWRNNGPAPYASPTRGGAGSTKRVILVRHGEKARRSDNYGLSAAGYLRAALFPLFFNLTTATQFNDRALGAIYAKRSDSVSPSTRPIETMVPLAIDRSLDISDHFAVTEGAALMRRILLGTAADDDRIALICWEHRAIPSMLSGVGATTVVSWSTDPTAPSMEDDLFDVAWIVDFVPSAAAPSVSATLVGSATLTVLRTFGVDPAVTSMSQVHDELARAVATRQLAGTDPVPLAQLSFEFRVA